jgi:hypothetical protein
MKRHSIAHSLAVAIVASPVAACALFGLSTAAHAQQSILDVTGSDQINEINAQTGASTLLYAGPGTGGYNAAGYDSSNGLMYFANLNNQTLEAFNPATPGGAPFEVGSLPTDSQNLLGAGFSGGTYYAIGTNTDVIQYWSDLPSTAGSSALAPTGSATLNITGTGFTSLRLGDLIITNSGGLWISAQNGDDASKSALVYYSSLTGALAGDAPTDVFTTGALVNGLAYSPADDTVYGYSLTSGSFFTIDQADGKVETVINHTNPLFLQAGDLTEAFPATPGTVPEPSTWAMTLIGFGGLGYAAYRSRRKAVVAAA